MSHNLWVRANFQAFDGNEGSEIREPGLGRCVQDGLSRSVFLGRNAMGVGFDELGAEYITRQFYHEPVRHSLCCRGERWKKKVEQFEVSP